MTVIYGLDSSAPPTQTQAQRYFDLGYRFWCPYIGFTGFTPQVYTAAQVQMLADIGFKLLPIAVPPQSFVDSGAQWGNMTLQAMQSYRLSGTVVLDVENGAEPVDFIHAFGDALHAGQCALTLYGLPSTLIAAAAPQVDYYWMAKWMSFVNGVPPAPSDWDIWQVEDGSPCDFNCARADFPFARIS